METNGKELDWDELIRELREANARLRAENLQLKERIAAIEKRNPTRRLNEPYSLRSEEQRQAKTAGAGSTNRLRGGA